MTEQLIQEQIDYYRARAQEYDASLRELEMTAAEGDPADHGHALAHALLRKMGPYPFALELACGTGIWTATLAEIAGSVTALDAAPEMLTVARQKLAARPVTFVQADLFQWTPDHSYPLVFFAHWLSHVPPERRDSFLDTVTKAVTPGGQLVIVDQYAPFDEDRGAAQNDMTARRPLRDGRVFTIVKVFYHPGAVQEALQSRGFRVDLHLLDAHFYFLVATAPL